MDVDSPRAKSTPTGTNGLNGLGRHVNGISATAKVTEIISTFRPTKVPRKLISEYVSAHTNFSFKLFRREVDDKTTSILSLDFDDPGELLMTSESDESIQIYNVKDGKHQKSCLSKKYGVKLAKFTHTSSCIIYASTKENGTFISMLLLISEHC